MVSETSNTRLLHEATTIALLLVLYAYRRKTRHCLGWQKAILAHWMFILGAGASIGQLSAVGARLFQPVQLALGTALPPRTSRRKITNRTLWSALHSEYHRHLREIPLVQIETLICPIDISMTQRDMKSSL